MYGLKTINMKYRTEIDGLRAIAILSVVLFHAGFSFAKGGFIGVDIFFVISGFLMTSIILNEKTEGNFTLKKFYERRVRRILPMLFFTLIVSSVAAFYYLEEKDLMFFTRSSVTSIFAISNIFYSKNTGGYFDTSTDLIPLIHTWTLGVEEQFYIILPLIFIFLWKIGKNKLFVLISYLVLISFFLNFVFANKIHNFYLLHTRFWELGIGSLIAFIKRGNFTDFSISFGFNSKLNKINITKLFIDNLISAIALICVLLSVHFLHEKINNLQFRLLIPVLGTAFLILFATKETIVNKILSFKPLTWIGLISYSAYLIHQPLFAFLRISSFEPITKIEYGIASIITFVLAYFTWRFVENPFRNKQKISIKIIITLIAILILLFAITDITTKRKKGFPARFEMSAELKKSFEWHSKLSDGTIPNIVKIGNIKEKSHFILTGDSYASSIFPIFKDYGMAGEMFAYIGLCPTFVHPDDKERITAVAEKFLKSCFEIRYSGLKYLLSSDVKHVIFINFTPLHLGFRINVSEQEILDLYERGLDYFFKRLLNQNITIYIIPNSIEFKERNFKAIYQNLINSKSLTEANLKKYSVTRKDMEKQWIEMDKILSKYRDNPNVKIIHISDLICNQEYCPIGTKNNAYYADGLHFSSHGLKLIEDKIKTEILDDINSKTK